MASSVVAPLPPTPATLAVPPVAPTLAAQAARQAVARPAEANVPTVATVTAAPSAQDIRLIAAREGRMGLAGLMQQAAALQQASQAEQAPELYAAWIAHPKMPLRHVACFNWGALLAGLPRAGAERDAEAAHRQGLELQPGFCPALLNLGHLLEGRGDTASALAQWQAVLDSATPVETEHRLHALNNSARLLEQLRCYPEAEALMRRSLELKAAQPDVIQHHVHIRQKQCAWPLYAPVGRVTPNQWLVGTSALAMMGITDDPALQLLAAQRFVSERVAKPPPQPLWKQQSAQQPARSARCDQRIRVGYLSGDLHVPAVGLVTPELFELHDRSRFELHAFCWTITRARAGQADQGQHHRRCHRPGCAGDGTGAGGQARADRSAHPPGRHRLREAVPTGGGEAHGLRAHRLWRLEGYRAYISPDALGDPDKASTPGGAYYRALVLADGGVLRKAGKMLDVLPGMTAMVEIRTGQRSVLGYALRPLVKSQEAFRVR